MENEIQYNNGWYHRWEQNLLKKEKFIYLKKNRKFVFIFFLLNIQTFNIHLISPYVLKKRYWILKKIYFSISFGTNGDNMIMITYSRESLIIHLMMRI